MTCVTTVTYTVLINGQPHGLVIPQRGLRQGDPLSPFLFVLCTEGLTHLLNKAEQRGVINGVHFSPLGPAIHHLLFVDDSLFLCKARVDQIHSLQSILRTYGQVSGQTINLTKSSITFGHNIPNEIRLPIQTILGIYNEGGAGTYLGLPECFSGSKRDLLGFIEEKMRSRCSSWYAKCLSLSGKEILLKSVAMALPVYAMSCFKLPVTTCQKLTSVMSSFWWNTMENKQKIHWISWDKLCIPKHDGGLGFKDIQVFNQALLAKQAWRLLQYPNCLMSRVLKSRYYPDSNVLQAPLGSRPSFAWRSILHGRELLSKGLVPRLGDGKSVLIWTSPWIPASPYRAPLMKNILVNIDAKVHCLINQATRTWDRDRLRELFYEEDEALILQLHPIPEISDYWVWKYNRSGEYTVCSDYWLANEEANKDGLQVARTLPSLNPLKEMVWDLKTTPKIKNFLWRVLCGAIPVSDNLLHRGMRVDSRCQRCGVEGESANHVLFTCHVARQVWALSSFPLSCDGFNPHSVFQNLYYLISTSKDRLLSPEIGLSFPWILWHLWKTRNKLLFEGPHFCSLEVVNKALHDASQWSTAQHIERTIQASQNSTRFNHQDRWHPPPSNWLKCNVSFSWHNSSFECGAAWVLRNERGSVLLHGRCSFASVPSKLEASFSSLCWAIESMATLRFANVVFAFSDQCLVKAVSKPTASPSFLFQSTKLLALLRTVRNWKLIFESRSANLASYKIAHSASTGIDFNLTSPRVRLLGLGPSFSKRLKGFPRSDCLSRFVGF